MKTGVIGNGLMTEIETTSQHSGRSGDYAVIRGQKPKSPALFYFFKTKNPFICY